MIDVIQEFHATFAVRAAKSMTWCGRASGEDIGKRLAINLLACGLKISSAGEPTVFDIDFPRFKAIFCDFIPRHESTNRFSILNWRKILRDKIQGKESEPVTELK
jgi:hypothetical protein